ncbi:MAG: SDR family NAD(P)-dependent oxidoreductase, partial [Candidatus Aenigmatarchaeota archaeon]
MRVLLTGASSSPGFKTLIELSTRGYQVYAVYNTHSITVELPNITLIKLDLTQFEEVVKLFNEVKPDIVIHMAALGDVNLCEKDKGLAWKVNVDTTKLLAKLTSKHDLVFLYLSTDYVFDGEKGNYREEDIPNPINFYGLTKLVAEEIIRSSIDKHIVVRTSAIYGLGMGRKNFGKFLIEALSQGQKVRA